MILGHFVLVFNEERMERAFTSITAKRFSMILNLLPIPILDGGNILLLGIEGGLRRDLSMAFKERFVQVGLVFLLVLFAIVMYNDLARLLGGHS